HLPPEWGAARRHRQDAERGVGQQLPELRLQGARQLRQRDTEGQAPRRAAHRLPWLVSTYLFEHRWADERRRLDLLEQVFDGGTVEYLARVPLPPGGQCLEVGAGA